MTDDHPNRYAAYLREAVRVLEQGGSVSAATEYVDGIEDSEYRDHTRARLAVFLAEQDRPEALQVARSVDHPFERADALLDLGRTYAKRAVPGAAKEALLEAIASIHSLGRSTWEIPSVLLEAGTALRALGLTEDALETVRRAASLARVGGDLDSQKALAGCAVMLAKLGQPDEAFSTAQFVTDSEWRDFTLRRIENWIESIGRR